VRRRRDAPPAGDRTWAPMRPAWSGDRGRAAHEERHEEEDEKQADDERERPDVTWLSRLHGPFPQASRTESRPVRR